MTRTSLVLVVLIAAFTSTGCRRGRASATIAPAVPRELTGVAQFAQRDLDCSHVDLALFVLPTVVQVRGCGQRQEYITLPRRPPLAVQRVESIATREMNCAQRELNIESPAPAVRVIVGCERRARYDLHCGHAHCEWMMTAHTGRWAGLTPPAPTVPEQFDVTWALPPEVTTRTVSSTPPDIDLDTVPLPPPPDVIPEPPAP